MNSTKVLKVPQPDQFQNQFWSRPPFKIEKISKAPLKTHYEPKPFPLKKEQVANPSKKLMKEEEKGKWVYQNKENFSINDNSFTEMVKLPITKTPNKAKKFTSPSFLQLEKEVKLSSFELNHQESSGDFYDEERIAFEDEYGIDKDDIFKIDETDDFEDQNVLAENHENLDSALLRNENNETQQNQQENDSCSGLKKGIDNDAIIADVSTVDGLSMYEDLLEYTQKKIPEDEELEKIDIFFSGLVSKQEANDNVTHIDCNFSKANEEDFEEEKINTCLNKTPSENYPMLVDFKEDDYEMDIERAFNNGAMLEETVPLMKKHSYRMERGLSLFEEQQDMFMDDVSMNLSKKNSRERSYSKFTEDDWYRKDWRNHAITEQSIMSVDEKEFEDME